MEGRYYIYASKPQDEELIKEVVWRAADARQVVRELELEAFQIEEVLYVDEASEQHQVKGWTR